MNANSRQGGEKKDPSLLNRKNRVGGKTVYPLAVTGAVLIWSTSFTATKIALTSLPPLTIGALRFLLATFALGTILAVQGGFSRPTPGDLIRLLASGLLGITLYFSLENVGVQLATASDAALIVASYPAITMLLEMAFFRKRAMWFQLTGVGMAVFGVYLIVQGGPRDYAGPNRLLGDLILITTGIVWACYNFITRHIVRNHTAFTVTFYQMAFGTLAFLPLAWMERHLWQAPSSDSLLMIAFLGFGCSVAAFLLYAYGLRELEASSAVALMNLVPVFGVVFAVAVLAEPISSGQLLGGVAVIIGVLLSVRPEKAELREATTLEVTPANPRSGL